jgi:hypothetical protein
MHQKINKEILELNHTIEQMDLTDVYRMFHPTSAQYTFFSAAHGAFSKIDHILGHKASLSKYKKMEITPFQFKCIFSFVIALARTSTIVCNRNGKSVHPYFVPYLRGQAFIFFLH